MRASGSRCRAGLKTTASAAAQATVNTANAGNSARMSMRSRASNAPAIATMRIDTTPSKRSINTDATASTPPTPSFDRPVRAHGVAADARRQKRADERADEEDPHDGPGRRAAAVWPT